MIERSELLAPTSAEPATAPMTLSAGTYEAPGIESVITLEEMEREVHYAGGNTSTPL